MKKSFFVFSAFLLLCCCKVNAQVYGYYYYTNENGDTIRSIIDTTKVSRDFRGGCYCLPDLFERDKDGHFLLPPEHPSAKYFNDPKHWYWQNVSDEHPEFGGYWEVKPEYIDSMPDGEGGWLKAAFWTIERWKREEMQRQERNNFFKPDSLEFKIEPGKEPL